MLEVLGIALNTAAVIDIALSATRYSIVKSSVSDSDPFAQIRKPGNGSKKTG